jgi:hypothetical protein
MPQIDNPRHRETRALLRVLGPMIVGVGLIFMIVGIANFFAAFGGDGPPRLFWCFFVGMPILFVGIAICQFAFMGAVTRYTANEVAPVGKDVINYMADGTKDAVRDVAAAVGEGLRTGAPSKEVRLVRCHKCNVDNDTSANFCNACGAALKKSIPCSACGELNDPDARFCDECGKALD